MMKLLYVQSQSQEQLKLFLLMEFQATLLKYCSLNEYNENKIDIKFFWEMIYFLNIFLSIT